MYYTRCNKKMELLDKEKAKFRIVIMDLEKKESRTISLKDGSHSVEDIKKKVVECFTRKH